MSSNELKEMGIPKDQIDTEPNGKNPDTPLDRLVRPRGQPKRSVLRAIGFGGSRSTEEHDQYPNDNDCRTGDFFHRR